MGKIICFRTVQGIDLIGTLISETDAVYKVEKCLGIVIQANQEGGVHYSLAPLVFPTPPDAVKNSINIELNRVTVMFTYIPNDKLETIYRKNTSIIEI